MLPNMFHYCQTIHEVQVHKTEYCSHSDQMGSHTRKIHITLLQHNDVQDLSLKYVPAPFYCGLHS